MSNLSVNHFKIDPTYAIIIKIKNLLFDICFVSEINFTRF